MAPGNLKLDKWFSLYFSWLVLEKINSSLYMSVVYLQVTLYPEGKRKKLK